MICICHYFGTAEKVKVRKSGIFRQVACAKKNTIHTQNQVFGVFWRPCLLKSTNCKSLTALKNLSFILQSEPNFLATRVIFSLVCESKAGFSIRQLTNSQMWLLICNQRGTISRDEIRKKEKFLKNASQA